MGAIAVVLASLCRAVAPMGRSYSQPFWRASR